MSKICGDDSNDVLALLLTMSVVQKCHFNLLFEGLLVDFFVVAFVMKCLILNPNDSHWHCCKAS